MPPGFLFQLKSSPPLCRNAAATAATYAVFMSSIPDVINLPVPVPQPEAASHGTLRAAQVGIFAIACGLTVANIFYAQPLIGLIGPALGLAASRIGLPTTSQLAPSRMAWAGVATRF